MKHNHDLDMRIGFTWQRQKFELSAILDFQKAMKKIEKVAVSSRRVEQALSVF